MERVVEFSVESRCDQPRGSLLTSNQDHLPNPGKDIFSHIFIKFIFEIDF